MPASDTTVEITPEMIARAADLAEEMAEEMGLSVSGGAVSRLSWEGFVERLLRAALSSSRT